MLRNGSVIYMKIFFNPLRFPSDKSIGSFLQRFLVLNSNVLFLFSLKNHSSGSVISNLLRCYKSYSIVFIINSFVSPHVYFNLTISLPTFYKMIHSINNSSILFSLHLFDVRGKLQVILMRWQLKRGSP